MNPWAWAEDFLSAKENSIPCQVALNDGALGLLFFEDNKHVVGDGLNDWLEKNNVHRLNFQLESSKLLFVQELKDGKNLGFALNNSIVNISESLAKPLFLL